MPANHSSQSFRSLCPSRSATVGWLASKRLAALSPKNPLAGREAVFCQSMIAARVEGPYTPPSTFVVDPKKPKAVEFALAFATRQAEIDRLSRTLAEASQGDVVLWFAYPKGSSKR